MRRFPITLLRWIVPFAAVILLALSVLVKPAVSAGKQETPPEYERVAQMISKQMRVNHIPGAAIGIVRAGSVVHTQAFGAARQDQEMTVDTPMFIASVSKPITAVAVMQLVEAGRLELDRPVQDYLPWFQVADARVSARITVRHLLNQTSGLSDLGYTPQLQPNFMIEDAVRALSQAEPVAEPGERFMYFNPNYTTLGLLIETVSGQSYGDYLRQHVFEPLEMYHTYTSYNEARSAGLADGHLAIFGLPMPYRQKFLNYDLPAGFILSTAEDMSRFLIPHLEGGEYKGQRILSPASIELMHSTPEGIDSPYGMGWWVGPDDLEPRQMQHGGELDGFHADIVIMPDLRQGFVLLYNQNHMIYSLVTFTTIRDGTTALLTGGSEPFTISLTFFYRIAMILFLVHIILVVRSFVRLPHWERKSSTWPFERRVLDIVGSLVFPVILLVLLPLILKPVIGRGFDWELLFNKLPILVTWLFFVVVMSAAQGIGKIFLLLRNRAIRS
jgi:CubicO group peptidase (beta-lactamase class C family)